MLIALFTGLIVGFLMCIPVGPINVWVVNTFIERDFKSAFSIALGGSLMDFIYFMVILSGLSLFNFSTHTILVLKIVGVLFLFLFGLKSVLTKNQNFKLDDHVKKKAPKVAGYFFLGVLIYSSNPTLVATMSGLAAVIKSWKLFENILSNYFALSLGLACGSAFWFYLLLRIVKKYQNKIPEKFFLNFSRVCGILIILFSIYMAFNVYKENFV